MVDHVEPASSAAPVSSDDVENPSEPFAAMADLIIRERSVGSFKSTDCLPIIKKHWPNHPMAKMERTEFGKEFASKLWPLLEKRGVKRQETMPRKYEMTAEAKATK